MSDRGSRVAEEACSRTRRGTKNGRGIWETRPNSSGVRRQLNLPDCRRTLESVSGSRFADSRLRGFGVYIRARVVNRGRRFLSVHAAHHAHGTRHTAHSAPTLPPPPPSPPPPPPPPPSPPPSPPPPTFRFCCPLCVSLAVKSTGSPAGHPCTCL